MWRNLNYECSIDKNLYAFSCKYLIDWLKGIGQMNFCVKPNEKSLTKIQYTCLFSIVIRFLGRKPRRRKAQRHKARDSIQMYEA